MLKYQKGMWPSSVACCYVASGGYDVVCAGSVATGAYVSQSWAAVIHLVVYWPLMALRGTSTCLIMTPALKVTSQQCRHWATIQ